MEILLNCVIVQLLRYQKVVDGLGDGFSVREDLRQVPGAQDVPQRGGGQQTSGPVVVVIVTNRTQRVRDLIKIKDKD